MKNVILSLFLLSCFIPGCFTLAIAQSDYQVGTSSVSLEPRNGIFSLALAGYGLPREGRFSITWNYLDDIPTDIGEITAITALNEKFYISSRTNGLWAGHFLSGKISWKKVSRSERLKALTTLNGKLYGINKKNEILAGTLSGEGISWKKCGQTGNVISLTGLNGKLYAVNGSCEMLTGIPGKDGIEWKKLGHFDEIISMTSYNNNLYGLNEGDSIWSGKPNDTTVQWALIGRHNSFTYDIHLKNIFVHSDDLYGVTKNGKLYKSEQSTKGNLSARALAIKDGDQTIVMASVDLCGFTYDLANDIKEAIYTKRKIPRSAILVSATHTHFAPITQKWGTLGPFYAAPNQKYLLQVKEGVIAAIEQALDNMTPSDMYFYKGTTDIGHNRRGAANSEKPYDQTLDVVKIAGKDKAVRSVLFLTGCHPVFENSGRESYTLSANFPGVARELIQEKLEAGHAIFFQGCAGDINPRKDSYEITGKELAGDVLAALAEPGQEITGSLSYSLDTIHVSVEPWDIPRIRKFKEENMYKEGDIEAEKNVRWANLMLERYKKGTVPHSLPIYVQILTIGNWKFVGLSREVVTEYGPALRSIWPNHKVSVAGYCNDVSSYLPNDWHIKKNLYEGVNSFFWYGQPATFPLGVMKTVKNRIETLGR